MELELIRDTFTDQSTIGKLYVDGQYLCFVLEDKDRNLTSTMETNVIEMLKKHGITCIPYGRYKVELTMSNRFKRILPILIGVKGYEGVRIHTGNTSEDTLGCLIVGMNAEKNKVTQSVPAMNKLMDILTKVPYKQDVYITIKSNKK